MSDGLFSATELAEPDALPGFRLSRLEVLNWGTFDQRPWVFDLAGRNALLTGDIGSGKSTLVDAVTTLLMQANKIAYNKAAGADNRERDLRSYVRGHYKTTRDEQRGSSRPVSLRDGATYSVIVGVFSNQDLDRQVTVAQVFWLGADQEGQPSRFYVTAEHAMSIAGDFAGFGPRIADLKRRLRGAPRTTVTDGFADYARSYRRLLGIPSEQAVELFHQTVSMKAVGDLNEFVRSHMLEPFDVEDRIQKVVAHVDDLTKAHEAVLKAKRQLDDLAPVITDGAEHDRLADEVRRLEAVHGAIPDYFAHLTHRLLVTRLSELELEQADAAARVARDRTTVTELESRRTDLVTQRAQHGGDRLTRLAEDIAAASASRDRARSRHDDYARLLAETGLAPVTDAESFGARQHEIADVDARASAEIDQVQEAAGEIVARRRSAEAEAREINDELLSLRSRTSNIPRHTLDLRARLCEEIGASREALPFAGELIAVRDDSREWEGATERLLRGFALSLLVTPRLYPQVTQWVNDHHLRGRLVYYRVDRATSSRPLPEPGRLFDVLEIRPGEHADWLQSELAHRTDLVLANSMDEFRAERHAITRQGQVKSGRGRHEKDDRHDVHDAGRFVLGWSNERKIDALLERASRIHADVTAIADELADARTREQTLQQRRRGVAALRQTVDFAEIDWESQVRRIADLEQERAEIESSSDELARLAAALDDLDQSLATAQDRRRTSEGQLAVVEHSLEDVRRRLDEQTARCAAATLDVEAFESGGGARELAHHVPASLEASDRAETAATTAITASIHRQSNHLRTVDRRLQSAMSTFRTRYPVDARDLDDSPESLGEYRELHERIASDDLPRFEAEFRESLTTNTIREIVSFQAELNKQEELIKARIVRINDSLHGIDYNDGRYIRLEHHATPNTDIRDFRADLRACSAGAVSEDSEAYSEQKFLQVKQLIDRFKGREGLTEIDRRWTRNVTNVRNWLVFSASERWRESDEEHEHYTDSGGKSGGQKEKLAYTILAASLAYQFGLEWGRQRSHTFQFVVIDEAFGRGSDDSTRFALKLFGALGMQLLIVTPLQKIQVIEPYVSTVGLVDNPGGAGSRIQVLTIEDYRRRKSLHAVGSLAEGSGA